MARSPSPDTDNLSVKLTKRRLTRIMVVFAGTAALLLGGLGLLQWSVLQQSERNRDPYARTQNGLTLLAIHASDYIPFRRSNEPGAVTFVSESPTIEIGYTPGTAPFRASARASTGDTFPLDNGQTMQIPPRPLDFLLGKRYGVRFSLPQFGVPATYQWLDVTVEDRLGNKGTWRVYGLPQLQHALSPTAPLHETELVHNVSLQSRAWWDDQAVPNGRVGTAPVYAQVKAVVTPQALVRPNQAWSVQIESLTPEWKSVPQASLENAFQTSYDTDVKVGGPLFGPGNAYDTAQSPDAPASSAQHVVQIKGKLTQYETRRESVTFQNVPLAPITQYSKGWRLRLPPQGLTLTTPSGVHVLLLKNDFALDTKIHQPDDITVAYRVFLVPEIRRPAPRIGTTSANDPREQRVRIGAEIVVDNRTFQSVQNHYGFFLFPMQRLARKEYNACLVGLKPLKQPVLPRLTINVVFQTQVQTFPVSFTVPVRAGKPTDTWGEY